MADVRGKVPNLPKQYDGWSPPVPHGKFAYIDITPVSL
jgi:hypothetical protein